MNVNGKGEADSVTKNFNDIPKFLYGTAWKEDDTRRYVEDALGAGFRGIDTANQRKHYHEIEVGEGIKNCISRGLCTRKDLFLQTKFTSIHGQDSRLPYDLKAPLSLQVQQSFESSLSHLNTDYLDSYILHGPTRSRGLGSEDWEIWGAIEDLHQAGKTRFIGVSNVNIEQLRLLCGKARIKPAFVQNRCFARTGWDREVRRFCRENQIIYQGFSLLTANPEIFAKPAFADIVRRFGATPAQIVFRFAIHVGMMILTGTTQPAHMKEDLASLDFELSAKDIAAIEG